MDIKEEKKAIKNLKAYLMDEWELTEEQKDEFDNLVFRVLAVGKEEAKAQAVPEGFLLMPRKCTNKMAHAAKAVDGRLSAFKYADVYDAMVEAQEQKG